MTFDEVNEKFDIEFSEKIQFQGSGGITEEKDPTVPSWAKEPNKPTYTAEEVGAVSKEEFTTEFNKLSEEIADLNIPTDEHINELINSALGVVENGYY